MAPTPTRGSRTPASGPTRAREESPAPVIRTMPRPSKATKSRRGSLATLAAEGEEERTLARRGAAGQARTGQAKSTTGQEVKTGKIGKELAAKKLSYSSDSDVEAAPSRPAPRVVKSSTSSSHLAPSSGKSSTSGSLDSGCATSSKDSLSLGRRSSSSSDERSGHLAASSGGSDERVGSGRDSRKLSKSYEHLDRIEDRQRKISQPADIVGFGLLPSQVYRKAVKKGFEFSLMVVGESGLGKSTLVNSMFLTDIYSNEPEEREADQTLQVETHHCELEESGVRLALTVVDTPGYGDAVDNTGCWAPILAYIDQQFDDYLEGETRVNRVEVPDTLVHACLYFIAPTGHGLKPLDIDFMRRIHDKVNIIPVIGKADSCTHSEVAQFKAKILVQLEQHKIQIYSFPESELEPETQWMRERLPFAVVGSNTVLRDPETGAKYRGREYPWGTVNIEDQDHCDFMALRNLVLAHHMQDLKEVTHSLHYEKFRCMKLQQMMGNAELDDTKGKVPLADLEDHESLREAGLLDDLESELEDRYSSRSSRRLEGLETLGTGEREWLGEAARVEAARVNLGRRRNNSFLGEKTLWEKYQSASLSDLKPRSIESLLRGKKLRGLVMNISSRRGQ